MNRETNNSRELQLAEERFRLVVESSPAALVIVDARGNIAMINKQAENWFGYLRDELIGESIESLIPERFRGKHIHDRNNYLKNPQARPMGANVELFAQRKDGTEFPVDISLHPMFTETGMLVMAYIVDLTDRKLAEQEVQRRNTMERLALLGQLAGGVAHEIRNPLGVIRNAAYYLNMMSDSLDTESRESITEILEEVDRANRIVGDLLDFARDPPQHAETFDIVEFVRRLITNRWTVAAEKVRFESDLTEQIVVADSDQISRIIENLIVNAAQAAPNKSDADIVISISLSENRVHIDVSDAGTGISPEVRLRIFEPLFTTKTKGIGLGLAVSQRYAERNGGTLELLENTGSETVFRLSLPSHQADRSVTKH